MEKSEFETHPEANPGAVILRLIHFEWAEDGQFEDRASTFAVNREFPVPLFRTVDGDELEIITEHFHVSYTKQRFSPESLIFHFSGRSIKYGTPWRFGTPTEFNLGGTARTLDGVDGRCNMGQGVLSKAGYAVIDDSKSMLFDGNGFVAPRQAGDRVDCYLFCYGRDYKAAIRAFYAVSGKQPVIPRFDEYIALMDKFQGYGIPLSVAVLDMDWHYVSDERVPHAGWTGYTWDEKLFPDPARFRRDIHQRQLRITLNDHPHGGIHAHEAAYEEMTRFLGHEASDRNPILFDPASPKVMEAYFNILHRRLEREACDFWWIDWQQGPYCNIPGFDPLWLLNHFQYLDSNHWYPIGFSGDTVVTWESLAFQPEFTATASNIGYGWWSHDIGGHIRGHIRGIRDDELLIRSRWNSKEPWLYGDECCRAMAKFLRFRHRLVPYLYTQNVLGSRNDEPLVQPMYWSWPNETDAYEVPNQYFLGSELLVTPIVSPLDRRANLTSVKVWLPPRGRFVDILRDKKYPVLAPEGSIVTLERERNPGNGCLNPLGIEALVIVGKNGQANAQVPNSRKEWTIKFEQDTGELNARIPAGKLSLRFLGMDMIPRSFKLLVDGDLVDKGIDVQLDQYCNMPCLSIYFSGFDALLPTVVTIKLGPNPQLGVLDHTARLEELIRGYQIEVRMKDQLWNSIEGGKGHPLSIISSLLALGYDEAIVGPLIELIAADSRTLSASSCTRWPGRSH
ncbi:glycoside hydrolase superfamily [Aspergillus desertorum]